ncbi:MAG: DUF4159 domain-containing protein, partial [Pseudomonadota bacterium]
QGSSAPEIVWASDGIDYGSGAAFAEGLSSLGTLAALLEPRPRTMWLTHAETETASGLSVSAHRLDASETFIGTARAIAENGRLLGEAPFEFAPSTKQAGATFDLPLSVRNQIALIRLQNERSAGATLLLGSSARRPAVGLVAATAVDDQPLLSGLHYVERALAPYAEVQRAELPALLAGDVSALVIVDAGRLLDDDSAALRRWVENGGVLIRFAGPRLATLAADDADQALLPTALRTGGRALGGALSWDEPQKLAAFSEGGPFSALTPPEDVVVRRQVLAEPSLDLAEKTWASLQDGTPLVTGARLGAGWSVLFHVKADPQWSSLPLSVLFVDMLRQVAGLGGRASAAPTESAAALTPLTTLDGYGRLGSPPPIAPVPYARLIEGRAGPDAPPGLYGPADGSFALNAVRENDPLARLAPPVGAEVRPYGDEGPVRLGPALLAGAMLLLVLDGLIALALMGKLPRLRRGGRAVATSVLLALLLTPAGTREASAQSASADQALAATLDTRLAYVRTGQAEVDEVSAAGLAALSTFLQRRTALEPGEPAAIDIEQDEILFYPFLYWPVTAAVGPPSEEALRRIDSYLKTGGVILFDTKDQDRAAPGVLTAEGEALQALLERMDIPPLEPTPPEHVLTKSFFLLDEFPGRFTGGQVWVQARPAADAAFSGSSNDDVSPIVIGGHDWAGAWALDAYDRPMLPVIPGGEIQRQAAMRFGANLIMYTLTGNYKADQVHVPAILERLGQ